MKISNKSSIFVEMNFETIVPIRKFWLVQKILLFLSLSISSAIICLADNSKQLDESTNLNEKKCQDTVKPIDYLQAFFDDLKKFKPNAPWITDSFMNMNFQQFCIAFKHIVKLLTVPQERWFYFSDNPVDFNLENYWAECLWQCAFYERWMANLSLETNQLAYKDINHPKVSFIKILMNLEDLGCGKKLVDKYYQFYAFYTDCLSHFFCRAVYSCYESINDENGYKISLTTAKKSLSKMKQNLAILRKSKSFYPTYKMTLDNYKNILALLEAERIKTY